VIDLFNELILFQRNITSHTLFKIHNNNILWTLLIDTVRRNHLCITTTKVHAHSGDLNNDLVDRMAAAAHGFDSPVVNIERSSIPIPYLPLWKSIPIEQNLRKFITLLSRNIGFEKFLSLYRNLRYRTMDIHWEATFFYLNDDEDSSHTSFYASTVKANRIKHMFEEIPTIE